MIEYIDECIGCPADKGCIGDACAYSSVPVYYCDECGEEFDPEDLYYDDNKDMLCERCLLGRFDKVK